MKYFLLFVLIILTGCSNEIESRHVQAGQFLCFDQDGISSIEIDPVGSDLYICKDGAQFVIGYGNGLYFIRHNTEEKQSNDMLNRILLPKKMAEKKKEKVATTPPKDINKIMKPATNIVNEDRGL